MSDCDSAGESDRDGAWDETHGGAEAGESHTSRMTPAISVTIAPRIATSHERINDAAPQCDQA